MTTAPVDGLAVALEATGQLIGGVRQWDAPTPCPDWAARDLVGHLIIGNAIFARAMNGDPYTQLAAQAGSPPPDDELATAYGDGAGRLLDAFRRPGALAETVTVPFGAVPGLVALHLRLTELLVHGWDLAQATGQTAAFPAELAQQELEFTQAHLSEIPSGRSPFAPSRPVPADAGPLDQLVACLGRDPS
jgi:uncharacterized protein (TIGR03086 family)